MQCIAAQLHHANPGTAQRGGIDPAEWLIPPIRNPHNVTQIFATGRFCFLDEPHPFNFGIGSDGAGAQCQDGASRHTDPLRCDADMDHPGK